MLTIFTKKITINKGRFEVIENFKWKKPYNKQWAKTVKERLLQLHIICSLGIQATQEAFINSESKNTINQKIISAYTYLPGHWPFTKKKIISAYIIRVFGCVFTTNYLTSDSQIKMSNGNRRSSRRLGVDVFSTFEVN